MIFYDNGVDKPSIIGLVSGTAYPMDLVVYSDASGWEYVMYPYRFTTEGGKLRLVCPD